MAKVQKELTLDCDCAVSICDHAAEQIGELLRDTFDDGFDDGWVEAHERMRVFMIRAGMPGAEDLELPPPPPRTAIKTRVSRSTKKEYTH